MNKRELPKLRSKIRHKDGFTMIVVAVGYDYYQGQYSYGVWISESIGDGKSKKIDLDTFEKEWKLVEE